MLKLLALTLALCAAPAFAEESCSRLAEGSYVAGGTTTDTASYSPAANSAVLAAVVAYDTATMSISGNGLTWTTRINGATMGNGALLWVFVGASASPTTGAATLTFDTDAFVNWAIDNVTGVTVAGPTTSNTITATGTSTTLAATLAAFSDAANGVWAYGIAHDDVTITQGSGYSLTDTNKGTAVFSSSDASQCITTNDTSPDMTLASSIVWGFAAIELVDSAGGGGGSSSVPAKFRHYQQMKAR